MRQDEYNALLLERGEFRSTWERMPNKELTLDDLDVNEVFRTARVAVASGRLDESVVTDDAMALLDHFKVRRDGVLHNAAAVLFGKPELFDYPQCQIKMGWFRGNDCAEFRDNRHVFGHIARLMDEAVAFCFKHLNLSAKINGIEREEELEIPIKALRETLINAFAHRLYDNRGMTVYLAIYDDRVEIKNPGAFPVGFDTEHLYDFPKQESTPRNEVIAHVLYLRKSIETWGRGLKLVADECRRVGHPLPTVEVRNGYVITTFKRPQLENASAGKGVEASNEISISIPGKVNDGVNDRVNDRVNETQEKILAAIRENQFITQAELSRRIGISVVHVNKNMAKLKNIGLIRRIGSDNNGHWEIIDNANSHHATSDVMR